MYRDTYLDEIVRLAGRADFRVQQCNECIARSAENLGQAEYCCDGCFLPDLVCKECSVCRHRRLPFHRTEVCTTLPCFFVVFLIIYSKRWNGVNFVTESLGLTIQLNHASMYCENPIPCHSALRILHTNGIHKVAINYCGCSCAIPQHIQLMRHRIYPSTQVVVKTCASFELLGLLHKFALTTKASTHHFNCGLEKLTNGTRVGVPKSHYRSLFQMVLQWRHLHLLKWAARAHSQTPVALTSPSQLALMCPSCPHAGINIPDTWASAPVELRSVTPLTYPDFNCLTPADSFT